MVEQIFLGFDLNRVKYRNDVKNRIVVYEFFFFVVKMVGVGPLRGVPAVVLYHNL